MNRLLNIYVRWQQRGFTRWGRGTLIAIFPVLFVLLFLVLPGW